MANNSGVNKEEYVANQAGNSSSTNTSNTNNINNVSSTADLKSWADNEISQAQSAYKYYSNLNDTEGMEAAHDRAERARNLLGYYSDGSGSNLRKVDQDYVNQKVANAQTNWNTNMAAGNKQAADRNHIDAEFYRSLLGYTGGADGSQQINNTNTQQWVNDTVAQAQKDYQNASALGDTQAMNDAHYRAEYARAHLGYSGGENGSQNLNIYNGANYQSPEATPFVTNAKYGDTSGMYGVSNNDNDVNKGRTKVTYNGVDYWLDNTGSFYDGNGNYVGSGYNPNTGAFMYSDRDKAMNAALSDLEKRYGVKGWDNVLKRMGLTTVPEDLINAYMNGIGNQYINNYETGSNGKSNTNDGGKSSVDNAAYGSEGLFAKLIDALIANSKGGQQFITPDKWNYPINNYVTDLGTMTTGRNNATNTTPDNYEQFLAQVLTNTNKNLF